jgi:hypothetical protein
MADPDADAFAYRRRRAGNRRAQDAARIDECDYALRDRRERFRGNGLAHGVGVAHDRANDRSGQQFW